MTSEERIEAIQAAMADDEFLSVARADDLRWLVKELAEAEQRRVDLVASLNEAGAFLMRVQAELHEARTEGDKWKLLATDAYSFLGPRENATGDLDDDLRNLLQGHMHCARIEKERDEARERATAAEAERDDERSMRVDRSLALNKALGERDQLRAELERERGDTKRIERLNSWPWVNSDDDYIGALIRGWYWQGVGYKSLREALDAMGVAEEPTGGKPE